MQYSSANRKLLLDFDGVVLNSPVANRLIKSRCTSYLSLKTGITESYQLNKLNNHLYTGYGHTLLGLKQLGYTCSIDEFNDYVYRDIDYGHLSRLMKKEEFGGNDIGRLMMDGGYDVYIFSNAHIGWVYGICRAMDFCLRGVKVLDVSDYHLKPEDSAYELALEMIGDDNNKVMFVDDSISNIVPLRQRNLWSPILYDANNAYGELLEVRRISSLTDLLFNKF